jgi:hypothetical protein
MLCADWGKDIRKRSLYVADVSTRSVRRVAGSAWSLGTVLKEAERWASIGPVLATFDAPLGIPEIGQHNPHQRDVLRWTRAVVI